MALTQTVNEMRNLLTQIQSDLEKAVGGNKAASQRVRTGTVSLEKIAKRYRKESIVTEKGKAKSTRKPAAGKKKVVTKAGASKASATKAVVKSHPKAKAAPAKAKPKAKAKTAARPRPLAVKRPTAKLPVKRRAHF